MKLKSYLIAVTLSLGGICSSAAPPAVTERQPVTPAERETSRLNAEKTADAIVSAAESRLNRQGESISGDRIDNEKTLSLTEGSRIFSKTKFQPQEMRTPRNTPGKVKTGTFFAREYNMNAEKNNSHQQTLALEKDKTYSMTNIFGLKGTILIEIDEASGTVTIEPQKVYTHPTYGDLWMCPVNLQQPSYSSSDPIIGSIDADGIITLPSWGIFSIEGQYTGLNLGVITETKWMPVNATINITAPKEADNKTYEAVVEQVSDNEINLFNIVGNGNYVALRLYPDKSVKMSPQWVFTHVLLGDVCVYSADFEANKVYRSIPVNGTATENSITLESWVATLSTGTQYSTQAKSTHISISGMKLRFPTVTPFALEGDGTQDNPYKVKSAADLKAISQATAAGNSFQGKHFEMASDINLSGLTYTYEPIGEESAPFKGHFNGKGHTIKSLDSDGRGFPEMGIFGYTGPGALIENVNLSGITMRHSGATLGCLVAVSYGRVSNCNVNARIVSTGEVAGGIVGQSVGRIENCKFTGKIEGTGCIAGIAGLSYSSIHNCATEANISLTGVHSQMYSQAAGIAGQLFTPDGMERSGIYDSYSSGSINDTYGFSPVGGVVCLASNSTVERCYNTASITAILKDTKYDTNTGGVAAWSSGSVIKDCFNAGTIMKTLGQGVKASEMVGGVVGYLSVSYILSGGSVTIKNVSDISNCYNSGQIISPSKAGHKGIYGDTFYYSGYDPVALSIRDCWFDNQVNEFDDETFGRPTSFFTYGLPDKLDKSKWTANTGYYPVLSYSVGSQNGSLAAATLTLDSGERADKVKKTSKIKSDNNVEWKFYENSKYVDETESMRISGSDIMIKNEYGTNMLFARTPGGFFKAIRLKAVPKAYDGEGTSESPYLIKTAADMVRLNEAVTKFAQPHEGDFFAMTADIDFSGSDFRGIGTSTYEFGATFDGKNHTIHNFKFKANANEWYTGLFHVANEHSTIRNLNIASDCSFDVFHYGAAIAGCSEGLIENCSNDAPVNNPGNFGAGIAGLLGINGEVRNCYNSGAITGAEPGAAGIVGMNIGKVVLCQNDGPVRSGGTGESGGIVSTHAGEIDRCVNNATIIGSALTGGIAGSVNMTYEKGYIYNSINNGLVEITGTGSHVGAAVGYIQGTSDFKNNYYDASINITGSVSGNGNSGFKGLPTLTLTDGKPLDGLSADDFSFEAGKYPVLKLFAEKEASRVLRCITLKFAEGESRANLTADAELSTANEAKWSVKVGKNFKINGNKLTVIVPEGMKVENDTVVASVGSRYSKYYPVRTMPDVLEGKGSITNPYQIKSAEDLYHLAVFIDSTAMDYTGYYFKVMNDIDAKGKDFKPLGMTERSQGHVKFNGNLDGNNKKVTGINYVNTDYKTGKYFGFVCTLGEAGVIRDLTLEGSMEAHTGCAGFAGRSYGTIDNCINRIKVEATVGQGYHAGFVASALDGSSVLNCINEVDIEVEKSFAAGIVAAASFGSRIENCVNKGKITTLSTSGGGIAAESTAVIVNCRNEAPVKSRTITGGIIARAGAKLNQIIDCENHGDVECLELNIAGGICGQVPLTSQVEIIRCKNYGNVKAISKTGGIVGEARSGTTILNSSNHGNIHSTAASGTWVGSAGGICGQLCGSSSYPSKAEGCYNTGEVRCHEAYTGGIAGRLSSATLKDCYNLGKIISEKGTESGAKKVWETGGICGNNTDVVEACWNAGEVISNGYAVGGVAGLASADIIDCFNLGNVTVTEAYDRPTWGGVAGGLIGYAPLKAEIRNCFNLGTVTAPDYAGGIASGISYESSIANCYNAGRVTGTDQAASHIYNIAGYTSTTRLPESYSYIYYLAGINPQATGSAALDAECTGLDALHLVTAPMGEAFRYVRGCMPTLNSTVEKTYANHAAIGVEFLGQDNADNVTSAVYLGQLENVEWVCPANAEIKEGFLYPKAKGEMLLKAVALDGALEKTLKLNIIDMLGTEMTEADNAIIECEYYDMQGRRIPAPVKGEICIKRIKYASGKIEAVKTQF